MGNESLQEVLIHKISVSIDNNKTNALLFLNIFQNISIDMLWRFINTVLELEGLQHDSYVDEEIQDG